MAALRREFERAGSGDSCRRLSQGTVPEGSLGEIPTGQLQTAVAKHLFYGQFLVDRFRGRCQRTAPELGLGDRYRRQLDTTARGERYRRKPPSRP
jgi:hypothetical protein